MIKYLVLLFNLIGLFLYQLFFQTNVTATQSVPASADAGSSFVVEVSINKADISGFAKYQEDLPKGFTAVAVDKQGATVLSSDNAIKFIWASLPSDATIKISFRVTVDASVSGSQPLSGKFLYVVNNERQEADVPASNITINGSAPVATNTVTATPADTQPAATTTDNSSQPAVTNTTPAVTTTDNNTQAPANNTTTTSAPVDNSTAPANNTANTITPPVNAPAPSITVSASRSLSGTSVEAASDITISVTIHKSTLSGFAKLEETLPNGVIAAEGDKQGASFTFVDNKVKFVWLSLPTDSVFTVSYKLTPGSTVSGDQSVTGEFSYLLDNNAAKYELAASTFTVKNAALTTSNTAQPATTNNPPVTTTTAPDNSQSTTTTPPVTTTTAPDNSQSTTTTPPVTTTTTPDNSQSTTTTSPVTTNTAPDNSQSTTTTPVTTTTTPDNSQSTTTTPPVTTTTTPDNSQSTTTTPPVTTTTVPDNTQATNTTPPATTTTPPVADMTSVVTPHISGANGGVMYRIQIMALHNAVKPSYLSSKYRISESINEEMIEGYTKYTVGKFDEYKSSRDHREEIKSKGVAGPFVVAYNDGKRITVQEALMITHQQWYK